MRSPFNLAFRAALICVLQLGLSFVPELSHAQTRKPTAKEIASIRDCVTKTKDDSDAGERKCLFKLVADPCIKRAGYATETIEVDCHDMEKLIWDGLLNDNYKSLLDTLDDSQTAKARDMQRVDGISRHDLRFLLRQNPRHDGELDDGRLRYSRNGTTGDTA